jgi:hypothetical protein
MTLDELIAQGTNPREFTRLCNSVFTDIYGDSFSATRLSKPCGLSSRLP